MYNVIKKFFGLIKNESKAVVLNKSNVIGDLKTATKKTTRFRQSLELNEVEQFYYDQSRQLMLDNGFASMGHFIRDELPTIPEEALKITKERFAEILMIAEQDYCTLMFDPHGLKSGF